MQVYIITSGEYSEYGIDHVTLDKQKADRYCAVLNSKARYRDYRVEEYKLDDFEVSEDIEIWWKVVVEIKNPYRLYGFKPEVVIRDAYGVLPDTEGDILVQYERAYVSVVMRELDEDKACKIALDRLAKWKAEQAEKVSAVLRGDIWRK